MESSMVAAVLSFAAAKRSQIGCGGLPGADNLDLEIVVVLVAKCAT
jgi:hypothetical protein